MTAVKSFAKGALLCKEGEKILNLHFIQTGQVQVVVQKAKKNLEIYTAGPGSVLGEQGISGGVYQFSAIAVSEVKAVEVPVDLIKKQFDLQNQFLKTISKSLLDRNRWALGEIKTYKAEKESVPCSDEATPRVFGALFHTLNHKGQRPEVKNSLPRPDEVASPAGIKIQWKFLKQYAQRIFGESLKRLEGACQILVKLGYARFELGKDPDDPESPEQIMAFEVFRLDLIESFFEHYQYHHYKSGRTDILRADDSAMALLFTFLKASENLELDRFGAVRLEYQKLIEAVKSELGYQLNNDHFAKLENKGVLVKRSTDSQGNPFISFERKEFQTIMEIWKIIREIEKWNEKGFVDLNEKFEIIKPQVSSGGTESCPSCQATVPAQAKFCPECGAKLAPIAKAS
jgi:hypothetical protein